MSIAGAIGLGFGGGAAAPASSTGSSTSSSSTATGVTAMRLKTVKRNILGFGETVEYRPANAVSRSLMMRIRPHTKHDDDEATVRENDDIVCFVGRDENEAEIGGVSLPQVGDTLLREVAQDSRREPYAFTGVVLAETPAFWRIIFSRVRQQSQGRGRR